MNALRWRKARWLHWLLVGLYVPLMGAGLVLQEAAGATLLGVSFAVHILTGVVFLVWVFVGALLVSRHPEHPVGWIFLALPLIQAFDSFTFGYAYYGTLYHPGSLPGAGALVFWQYSSGIPGLLMLTLLFLLFPGGRPLSRSWRKVTIASIGVVAVYVVLATLAPESALSFPAPFPDNPFRLSESLLSLLEAPRRIFYVLSGTTTVAAMFSMFLRLRRSTGVERQQIKWFIYAAAFFPNAVILILLEEFALLPGPEAAWAGAIGQGLALFSIAGIAVASAVAILRYRLYDIDIIIRRTLQYAILTGILALVYFGLVVIFQAAFAAVTDVQSGIFIVITTLVIAGLFNRLRGRVQQAVDRRFYRKKYDAEQALARFATAARDEVDLDRLAAALLEVIEETMQPEIIGLWLASE